MSLSEGGTGREIDDEIRHHLDELADLLVAEGWEPEAARREAERRFGSVARIRSELGRVHRTGGPSARLLSLWSDVRYAVRALRARPTYVASVVTTLALGLGAAASIFAVVDALLLRPLPYREADRWFEVAQATRDGGYAMGLDDERFTTWRDALDGVTDAWIAYSPAAIVRTDGERAEQIHALAVTPGAERLLAIPLLAGRGFVAEDAVPGATAVTVLSRAYWERTGADPDILGSTLHTEVGPLLVVGILRGATRFPATGTQPDVWIPIRSDLTWAERRLQGVPGVWARLGPGVTPEGAQARADVVGEGLTEERPADMLWQVRLVPIGAHRANPDVRQAVWTLVATVAGIFLIALVNGVNLTLVRASTRLREVAVRLALGGSRVRLLRHFLVEGAVLGILGGIAALFMGRGALHLLRGLLPRELVWFSPHAFTVEARTTLMVAGAALGAGVALGVLPALRALGGTEPAEALGGRGPDDRPGVRRFRNGLVVLQVALTTTLLVVAGLLSRSMVRLLAEDPGFDVAHTADASVFPSSSRYHDAADRWAFAARLKEALEARPEVEAVTVLSDVGFAFDTRLEAEGSDPPTDQPMLVPNGAADTDYVEAIGATLVEGRGLTEQDVGTRNALVDRDMARLLWPGGRAVGQRFRLDEDRDWMTVVGVLAELRLMGRDQRQGPYQFLVARGDGEGSGAYLDFVMRTRGDPATLLPAFHETLRRVDPEQWAWKVRTSAGALAEEEQTPRFLLTVLGILATIATALSAVGLYGVLSYSVSCRRRELGIRVALGADRTRLRGRVLREGMVVAGLGLASGCAGALALSGLLSRLLYRLEPMDPTTYAGVLMLLAVVAGLASTLPARRATRVDPVEVLRTE